MHYVIYVVDELCNNALITLTLTLVLWTCTVFTVTVSEACVVCFS